MKKLFLLTVLVVATSALPSDLSNLMDTIYLGGRIVRGEIASIEEAPYQVSISLNGRFYCGGCIISSEWILTAAHCALHPVDNYEVRTGSDSPYFGGHSHKVVEKYVHKGYLMNGVGVPRNDIALFRVGKPIEIDAKQRPVTLFDKDEEAKVGAYAVITGYGTMEDGRLSSTLRSVTIPIVSKQDCFDAYIPLFRGIEEHQICASYPNGGKDACEGDSGGPMTISGRLAGIVSWGDGCGIAGNPGVYTEISKYRDWISTTSGLNL